MALEARVNIDGERFVVVLDRESGRMILEFDVYVIVGGAEIWMARDQQPRPRTEDELRTIVERALKKAERRRRKAPA